MKVGQVSMTTFKYKSWNAELKKTKKTRKTDWMKKHLALKS